jgi:L-ascorbate metabolism protein UlaG (beta-lactamase superfamily)
VFAGDTAHTDTYDDYGPAELAVFGIGAYDPREHMHATPEQVWRMFSRMQARWLLPIHHSTFELSDEPVEEPMRRLLLAARGKQDRVIQVAPGELWTPPAATPSRAHV